MKPIVGTLSSMSTMIGGPGWWLASDGRWYPPETHPDYRRRTQEMWAASPAENPDQASAPLEMAAPGPIPPAFSLSNGPVDTAAQVGRTIMVEPARYLGGFAPEPETQDSSFLRCTEAGVQFRTRRGVAWVPWNDVWGMKVEGPDEVGRRFRENSQLSPAASGLAGRREGTAYVVALSGASEIVFEVGGTTPDELRHAMQPVLDRFGPGPAPSDLATSGLPASLTEVPVTEVPVPEASGPAPTDPSAWTVTADPATPGTAAESWAAPASAVESTAFGPGPGDAVQVFLDNAAAQGLLEPLHGAADEESLRAATRALDAARSAADAALAAAAEAENAAESVHRFTVVRNSEAEIGELLVRCQRFIENAVTQAERQAYEIVAAARAEAGTILADASRRAGELQAQVQVQVQTLPPGPPPVISPETARELNSTIDGYIKVNNELMHELRLLSGSFGQLQEASAPPPAPQPSFPSP